MLYRYKILYPGWWPLNPPENQLPLWYVWTWKTWKNIENCGIVIIHGYSTLKNRHNKHTMIWEVRHKCPSGAQYTFNCYRNWSTLVIRDAVGTDHFLYIKGGMNQTPPPPPLTMISYILGVLPLIQELWAAHPQVTQPWYVGDVGGGGNFPHILAYLEKLMAQVPPMDYLTDTNKIILVV